MFPLFFFLNQNCSYYPLWSNLYNSLHLAFWQANYLSNLLSQYKVYTDLSQYKVPDVLKYLLFIAPFIQWIFPLLLEGAVTVGPLISSGSCSVTQSCRTLHDAMSPPGSSFHGVFWARILEWVATSSSRGSSQPRDRTHVSCISCIGRQILYHCATWEDFECNQWPSDLIHSVRCLACQEHEYSFPKRPIHISVTEIRKKFRKSVLFIKWQPSKLRSQEAKIHIVAES